MSGAIASLRVLICDGDPARAEPLARAVRACGHDAVVVCSAGGATAALRRERMDVVFVAGVEGEDLGARVTSFRRAAAPGALSVVVLTGGLRDDEATARAAGARALTRADDVAMVENLLETLLADAHPSRSAGPPAAGPGDDAFTDEPTSPTVSLDFHDATTPDPPPAHGSDGDPPNTGAPSNPDARPPRTESRSPRGPSARPSPSAADVPLVDAGAGALAPAVFGQLLARAANERFTGAIRFSAPHDGRYARRPTTTGEPARKDVFFRVGIPVYVRSALLDECLGTLLYRAGIIDRELLDESARRVLEGDGRQGEVLVALRALSHHDLAIALRDQLRTKVVDLFAWDAGDWQPLSETEPPQQLAIERSLIELVWEGTHHRLSDAALAAWLAPRNHEVATVSSERLERVLATERLPRFDDVTNALAAGASIEDVLRARGQSSSVARWLVALETLGAIVVSVDAPSGGVTPPIGLSDGASARVRADPRAPERHAPPDAPGDDRPATGAPDRSSDDDSPPDARSARDALEAEAHFRRGERALRRDAYDTALAAFERALALKPNEGEFLAFAAYARFLSLGVVQDTPASAETVAAILSDLRRARKRSPALAIAHLLEARVLRALGDVTRARRAYLRVLEASPSDVEAKDALAALTDT